MSHLPLAVTMVKHGKNMSTIEHGKKKLCAISNIYIYILTIEGNRPKMDLCYEL